MLAFLARHAVFGCLLLTLIGSARIVSTYTVFNHTIDEPLHIASGVEWLSMGRFDYDAENPPLGHIAEALGPWLAGAHSWGKSSMSDEGATILYADGGIHYDRNLSLARLGILPFFWVACLVVFRWTRDLFGPLTALLATLLFTNLPPVLAHAGLATTDMVFTAMFCAAFYMLLRWVTAPTLVTTTLFGAALGLALLAKFTTFVYFPAAVAVAAIWFCIRDKTALSAFRSTLARRALLCGVALAIAAVVVWSGYRFSFGPTFLGQKLPAPAFFDGFHLARTINAAGHPSYMLGQRTNSGFWYFYLVGLAIKTPIGYLILFGIGSVLCLRAKRAAISVPLAFCAVILLMSTMIRINIGIRHVLPLYVAFSVIAAHGAASMLRARARWAPALAAILMGWYLLSSALAHPDYIPYFNEIAASEPENWMVDSDLDWGQDVKQLSRRLRELGAQQVSFSPCIVGDLERMHGLPRLGYNNPAHPDPGWNAVSPTNWKLLRLWEKNPEAAVWPDRAKPRERVGAILLYYFPPPPSPSRAPSR